ncbi:hypothetical protein B0T26DRAFT_673062 [Lasiosphaeria miniovina]|uniref:Amidohydrolase-related domain-containing protein n=1 Tax=Lasiosphaeria miniovina TaxID=1954250 RepID=A0AA40B6H9_9PEZI|nr:uncharacterized protein B0T26DRAFT_673062 [Lasiosphaeria miniovina]KAK0728548.1 hypothetical protein B0T26DRAFT_673062 [Lasiosphaeria miniovina]
MSRIYISAPGSIQVPDDRPRAPIIDSHVHLYPASEQTSLAWYIPGSPLSGQYSVEQYHQDTSSNDPAPEGLIFIEADRRNDHSKNWARPLDEVLWARRIVTGQPKPNEGHNLGDADLCLAIIPWAPMDQGPEELERYLNLVQNLAGPAWPKVKGFRFLLQDKNNGTGLTDKFIGSLKLLGKKKFVFEVGIDAHQRDLKQMEEALEMIKRAHDVEEGKEDEKVVFILDHMCKPDLSASDEWRYNFVRILCNLSDCGGSNIYMKLSGGFSELPVDERTLPDEKVYGILSRWLPMYSAFGPARVMFGSDWPVCNLGTGRGAWRKWYNMIRMMCYHSKLSLEEETMIFSGTARKAYKLDDETPVVVV